MNIPCWQAGLAIHTTSIISGSSRFHPNMLLVLGQHHLLVFAVKTQACFRVLACESKPREAKPCSRLAGMALGMVMQLPEEADETSVSRTQLLAKLDVCMGGRVAEELIFGDKDVTTGASSDLEQVFW